MSRTNILKALLLATVVAGCGGGGGDTANSPPPPPPQASPPASTTPPTSANPQVEVDFQETSEAFPNPERGFYVVGQGGALRQLTRQDVSNAYASGIRLIYARLDLAEFINAPISQQRLELLREKLDLARSGGVKLILRAAYNYPQSETEYRNAQDASLARVLEHISQLEPVLRENADVIASVQAGFIGAWGEWHTSSNGLTSTENREQIRDALLAAVPSNRYVQFRYPPDLINWTPNLPDLSTALNGSFRIGFHNDCFLASETDVGTYSSNSSERANQRLYTQQLGALGPFGGETCNPLDESGAIARTSCLDILREGADYKLTYLNSLYYRDEFHDNWVASGCMQDVQRSMGYRFVLESVSHSSELSKDEAMRFSMTIRNDGWARLYNPRQVQVIFREPTSQDTFHVGLDSIDPRAWTPGARAQQSAEFDLPDGIAPGEWDILIAMPDLSGSIAGDPRFSVRFANQDVVSEGQYWDENLGAYALGTTVTIQ